MKWSEVAQSCLTLYDPMDTSQLGSSVRGIFQARILKWGCHCLLQGIFPTQGSNLGVPCCGQMLYHLDYLGNCFTSIYIVLLLIKKFISQQRKYSKAFVHRIKHFVVVVVCFSLDTWSFRSMGVAGRRGWLTEDSVMMSVLRQNSKRIKFYITQCLICFEAIWTTL